MIKRRPAVLILLLALAACSSNNQARRAIAIVDVTVVDVQRGVGLPHMDVITEGDKIASVAPTGEGLPSDANVISFKGRFLIPGLWDMQQPAVRGRTLDPLVVLLRGARLRKRAQHAG